MAEEDPDLLSEGKKQEDDADNEIAVTDGTLPKAAIGKWSTD